MDDLPGEWAQPSEIAKGLIGKLVSDRIGQHLDPVDRGTPLHQFLAYRVAIALVIESLLRHGLHAHPALLSYYGATCAEVHAVSADLKLEAIL